MKKGVKKIIGGGLLFAIGVVLPFAFIIPIFFQEDDAILRAPGSVEITIDKPGRYYLWNNYSTVFEGRSYSFDKELPNGLSFSLIEEDSSSTIPMKSDLSISSASGSEKKSSIGYFKLMKPGQYTLSISGNTEERIFSFGESIFGNVVLFIGRIMIGVLLAVAAVVGALVLIVLGIIDLVRESNSDRQGVEATR
jgi:putative Mn2+ efflux pump MntP